MANQTVSLIRDDHTNDSYLQVVNEDGSFYLCDFNGEVVELSRWTLTKEIGTVDSDDDDTFHELVEPYAAGATFLAEWKDAGRPQVEMISIPSSGNATSHKLSHGDVIATASMTCPMVFKSENGFVSLGWDFEMVGVRSSMNKLMFELPEA